MKENFNWMFVIFVTGVIGFLFFGFWYIIAIKPIICNYHLKKSKQLYPEFYSIMEKRDSICLNERSKAYDEEEKIQNSIDYILKEMPYTPLEDQTAKRMEIEVLKKKRLKAKLEIKRWNAEVNELNKQIEQIIDESELLKKIYRNCW